MFRCDHQEAVCAQKSEVHEHERNCHLTKFICWCSKNWGLEG